VHPFFRLVLIVSLASACRPARPTDENARIVLERAPCFGFCPAYRVVVESDGTVRFTGIGDRAGRTDSARVSPEAVRALAAQFDEAKFFAMDSAYIPTERGCGIHATDHAYATLTAEIGGRVKSVRHYLGCTGTENPDSIAGRQEDRPGALGALTRLATAVDSVAGTSRWLGEPPAR
jgi:hypothetical protein